MALVRALLVVVALLCAPAVGGPAEAAGAPPAVSSAACEPGEELRGSPEAGLRAPARRPVLIHPAPAPAAPPRAAHAEPPTSPSRAALRTVVLRC